MSNDSLAFVFPGQGSQTVGMLSDVYSQYGEVRETFAEASEALGEDVWALVESGPQESLNMTANTQPVLLTCSVALWRAWQAAGGSQPSIMAGHSLGEFSALVCAQVFRFDDAVRLVRKRGEFMQSAVPAGQGAMAAIIGLDDDAINKVCEDVSSSGVGVVAAVNYNSPGQVVIAGHTAAVDAANVGLKEAGAKRAMPLPVSAPFHTSLMEPAGVSLQEELVNIEMAAPTIPIVHNVHAQTEQDPQAIRELLTRQIHLPVLWTACVGAAVDAGARCFVECGPGKVLSGLNRRIDKTLKSFAIDAPEALQAAVSDVKAIEGES
ncbi:MAG: ACP S-malonyltransferase [Halioglobus sp.]